MSANYSLYIPTINKKYTVEVIINTFWKLFIGNVDRIDFVPIIKTRNDEEVEDPNFRQAFIYIRPGANWGEFVTDAIEKSGSFRLFPHQETQNKEYWLLLKNKNPVPYATTTLNVHQLVHNNSLLETKVAEMEQEMLKMKEEIARLTQETNRERSSSCSTTEEEAEAFVQSWEHILQMIEERTIYQEEEQDEDEDGEYDRRREEEEKYLVYDDSGEMTPRGRMPILEPFNCLLTKE